MIFKEQRRKFLEELKFHAVQKGVVFDEELELKWMKAKSKPRFLEAFVDALALELDRIEEEKKEHDKLLFGEGSTGDIQTDENDRSQSTDGYRVNSDGSVGSRDSTPGGDDTVSKWNSKAYAPSVTTYHWSRKNEYFKNKINIIKESSPTVQKAFTIKRRVGSSVWAYYLDEPTDGANYEEFDLTLSTEPIRPEFEGLGFEDVVTKDLYEPDDVFQRKGRVSEPINLNIYPDLKMDDDLTGIGVDTARYGEDSTVILIRQGIHVVDVQRFAKNDTMETAGYVVQAINDWKPDYVNIETVGGLGAGVADRLLEMGLDDITSICQIETQSQITRYERLKAFNVRSEMFLLLKERFAEGRITLPANDEDLALEVVHIKYKVMSDGRLMIVENRDLKKVLGRSPDRAIALALAFYPIEITNIY